MINIANHIEPIWLSVHFLSLVKLKGVFMQIIRARVAIPHLLVGFGVCISIFGPSIKSNVAPRQFNPTVRSEVSKLEIIQTAMLGPNVLQVIMKNGYSTDITAVVAYIGDHKTTRTDYIYAEMEQDQKLSPGATDYFIYTIDSIEQENVVIKAVLFSDMTREGDFREIRNVLERRLGVRIQLARFNSHLENLSKVDDTRIQTEFQKARQVAENLPIKTDSNSPMSTAMEFGLNKGRAMILYYISKLNNTLAEDEKKSDSSNNSQPMSNKYEGFRDYSLRVKNDLKSLESRL